MLECSPTLGVQFRDKKTGIYYKLVKGTKVGYTSIGTFLKRDSTDNSGDSANSDDDFSQINPKLIDEKLNQELIDLFPGTVKDPKSQKIAEQWTVGEPMDDYNTPYDDLVSKELGNNFIGLSCYDETVYTTWVTRIKQGKISFQDFAKKSIYVNKGNSFLTANQYLPKPFDFTKYKIGAYVMPLFYWNDETTPFMILLVPSK